VWLTLIFSASWSPISPERRCRKVWSSTPAPTSSMVAADQRVGLLLGHAAALVAELDLYLDIGLPERGCSGIHLVPADTPIT
jgi:hypothetical protein